MMTSSRPNQVGGSFASRRGHSNQLSISDPSHHVTEAIGTLYDTEEEDSPQEGPQRAGSPRPLSFMSSSQPEEITRHTGTTADGRPQLDRLTTDNGGLLSVNSLSVPGAKKAPASPGRIPNRQGNSFETGPQSPTLSLKDVQDDPATSQFSLGTIENPRDIAQELSNLQALKRMSMDVGNNHDPDMLPFSGVSFMPSIAPTGDDDEGDPNRLLWVPARVHPELAPTEFQSFLESRVQSIKRRSGESLLSPDEGLGRSNSSGLRRKKSMLSRQVDPAGSGGRGFVDGAERLERRRSRGSRPGSDLTLDELVRDPNAVVQRLAQESKLKQGENSEDIPILPIAPGGGLRRSTRTTYRKGGSLRGAPFSRRIVSRQAEPEPSDDASTGTLDAPKGHGLVRTQSEPVPENFSRPTRPLRSAQKLSRESNSLSDSTVADAASQGAEEAGRASHNRSFHIDGSGPAPQVGDTSPSPQDDSSARRLFPQRSSSQKASAQMVPQAEAPQQHQHQQPFPDQPPPKSSRRQQAAAGRTGQPAASQQQASAKQANHGTVELGLNSGHVPVDGRANRTDSLTMIPTYTGDEKKSEKRGKKDKDDEPSSTSSSKSSWKWFKGGTDDRKKKDEEKKKSRGFVERAHDNVRLDVIQTSIENAVSKGRESLLLDREKDGMDNKLHEERKKDSHRKSDSKKEKDGNIFTSFFGGGKRRSERESGSKKSQHARRVSEEPVYRPLKPDVDYSWTRFPLLEERAIYRMAHIKLANPRRSLQSQVLLSNFMYNYLAIVQAMHPQMQIPTSPQQRRQEEERKRKEQEEQYLAEQQQQQQEEAQQGAGGDSIDRYTFDYHRDANQAQYGEAHAADESVDYMDDTHIYEYDERGEHGERGDDGSGYDGYGDGKDYYGYEQQENGDGNRREGSRRDGMW